jgi:hypothetical protein
MCDGEQTGRHGALKMSSGSRPEQAFFAPIEGRPAARLGIRLLLSL